jgi:ribonuclease BN (tRNA processing enzyme)
MSFAVIALDGKKSFFFSSDIDSIDEVDRYIDSSLSFVEAAHLRLEEVAAVSKKAGDNFFFTHIPKELETNGEWTKELSGRFGTQKLNVVHDGQIFTI